MSDGVKKVLVADDIPMIRASLRSVLAKTEGYDCVGEACCADSAYMQVKRLQPDIVLMDISMGQPNGLQATKLIKQDFPETRIAIFTVWDHTETLFAALSCGANGYITKTISPSELKRALDTIMTGQVWVVPSLAKVLVSLTDELVEKTPLEDAALDSAALKINDLVASQEYLMLRNVANGEYATDTLRINPKWMSEVLADCLSNCKDMDAMAETSYATGEVFSA